MRAVSLSLYSTALLSDYIVITSTCELHSKSHHSLIGAQRGRQRLCRLTESYLFSYSLHCFSFLWTETQRCG